MLYKVNTVCQHLCQEIESCQLSRDSLGLFLGPVPCSPKGLALHLLILWWSRLAFLHDFTILFCVPEPVQKQTFLFAFEHHIHGTLPHIFLISWRFIYVVAYTVVSLPLLCKALWYGHKMDFIDPFSIVLMDMCSYAKWPLDREYKERLKKEADHPRMIGGRFNIQGSLHMRLALGGLKISRSPCCRPEF